jgi:MYXO-CTERM domain-containing protein
VCCGEICCPSGTTCGADGTCEEQPSGGGGCTASYPIDCGDGFCCPADTQCVSVAGETKCRTEGGVQGGGEGGGSATPGAGGGGDASGEELLDPREREPRSYCSVSATSRSSWLALVLGLVGVAARRRRRS